MGSIRELGNLTGHDYSDIGFRFHHLSIEKWYLQGTLCRREKHRQADRQTKTLTR